MGAWKHKVNAKKFDQLDPLFYYFLGLYTADGWVYNSGYTICLSFASGGGYQLLEKLNKHFEYTKPIGNYKQGKEYRLTLTSKRLFLVLKRLGLIYAKKTYEADVPKHFPSKEHIRMYIRGLFDGDGNIKFAINKVRGDASLEAIRLCTFSIPLVEKTAKLIQDELKVNTTLTEQVTKGRRYPMWLIGGKKDGFKFLDWIYRDYEGFYMPSKYNLYKILKTMR